MHHAVLGIYSCAPTGGAPHCILIMSKKINEDKLRKKLDNYGVMETTLEWEMED